MLAYHSQVATVSLKLSLSETKRKNISFLTNLICVIRKRHKKSLTTIKSMGFNALRYQQSNMMIWEKLLGCWEPIMIGNIKRWGCGLQYVACLMLGKAQSSIKFEWFQIWRIKKERQRLLLQWQLQKAWEGSRYCRTH